MTEAEDTIISKYNVRPNTRRYSLSIETTGRSPAKRQKSSLVKYRRRSVCSRDEPNLTFLEHFDSLEINNVKKANDEIMSYSKKKNVQSLTFQDQGEASTNSNVNEIASISKSRNTRTSKNAAIEKCSSPQNICENPQSSSYFRKRSTRNTEANFDTCFVADYTAAFGKVPSASSSRRRSTSDSDSILDAGFIADYTDAYGEVQSSTYCRKRPTRSIEVNLDTGFIADCTDTYGEAKSSSNFRRRSTRNTEANLDTTFVADYNACQEKKVIRRKRKERRLSGIFRGTLNTGFIEEIHLNEKENIEPAEIIVEDYFESPTQINDSPIVAIETPTKYKLRRRTIKPPTEEDIIKYYTDKTIKKKKNLLETIFEPPDQKKMGAKKYRRFIDFNERMSSSKIKKRHTRVVRYNLWENAKPFSMEGFVERLAQIELGL